MLQDCTNKILVASTESRLLPYSANWQKNYKELLENPQLIAEFEQLCDGFTFVPSWDSLLITHDTFRIYARNIPAKEASWNFVTSVKRKFTQEQLRLRSSIYLQRRRFSHQE